MRVVIEADDGTQHEVRDNVEFLDWYNPQEAQELMEDVRETIIVLRESDLGVSDE